jgi:hypothetical protein
MKKVIASVLLLIVLSVDMFSKKGIDSTFMLYPENIIRITFNNNNRIKSAYYNLESAKYNFNLFESEYTQFNPLIVAPRVSASSEKVNSGNVVAGMEKRFFNGSYVSTSVGVDNYWGNGTAGSAVSYVETEAGFPLFSSSRALERIIKRTFEENELYTKNLDYVDAVRSNIRRALEQYYDLVPRISIYEMLKEYKDELTSILENDTFKISENDRRQMEGEKTNLSSQITGYEITLYTIKLDMALYMNIDNIDYDQIVRMGLNFNESTYFGKYYLQENIDTIFRKALKNDTEFKVLGVIKKNAQEKKRLAEKGKLDIYATTGGRYNYYDVVDSKRQDDFWYVHGGIKVKINDRKVLKYTIAKAQADIDAIDFVIKDRRNQIESDISILKENLMKKKEQIISTEESLNSWENIYEVKKNKFLAGEESVDNFIQAFRTLVATKQSYYKLENNYFDLIRDLDYVCGDYFTVINLTNN